MHMPSGMKMKGWQVGEFHLQGFLEDQETQDAWGLEVPEGHKLQVTPEGPSLSFHEPATPSRRQ